jgi:leucyl aminopeptidase
MLNITFVEKELPTNKAVVIFIDEQLKLDNQVLSLDQEYNGLITKATSDIGASFGRFGEIKTMNFVGKDGDVRYLLIVGIGNETKVKHFAIEELGGKILTCATNHKISNISIFSRKIGESEKSAVASLVGSGAFLASYKFDKYFTKQENKFAVENIEILTDNIDKSINTFNDKKSLGLGVFLTRDYVSEPPNILYPESYSENIIKDFESLDVDVEILGEREMRNLGMGALLGVGQGSNNESKLVIMQYNGTGKNEDPIALVGKGVTFDSGGISIKPSANMWDMKYDMAGSAAVVGTIKALALKKSRVNIVGVIGLVENMPSGSAQRPSDVVTTMSGQTAEVLNTDAEGRLVLADAIWYTQDRFKPKCVIDLATLTGAIVVALGNTFAGCFSNNDELADMLIKAGDKVNEKLWRMPLHKEFDDMIKSDIADVANISTPGGLAGSATAAHFIGRFIKENVVWAHLDIAGMAWEKKGRSICPKGATGYGVRLLSQFIEDNYEGR